MGTQIQEEIGGRTCALVCRVCTIGAWTFGLVSAGIVATFGAIRLFGPDGVSAVFGAGEYARGAGLCLTYTNWEGGAQGIIQATLVLMALVLSLSEHIGVRRLGLIGLLLWSALWLGEAMWHVVGSTTGGLVIPLLIAALLMTTYRAVRRWGWRGERPVSVAQRALRGRRVSM